VAADEIFVTADSVAMISDALVTGKAVGAIPAERSALGSIYLATMDRLRPGRRVHPRDLRFFWRALEEHHLAGTLERPRNAQVPDLPAQVAAWVHSILALDRQPADPQ
jgi:mitochondrial fission protein ELM1